MSLKLKLWGTTLAAVLALTGLAQAQPYGTNQARATVSRGAVALDLPEAGLVTLSVYDLSGHVVSKPVSHWMGAGHFEANPYQGLTRVGAYVVRLQAGSGVFIFQVNWTGSAATSSVRELTNSQLGQRPLAAATTSGCITFVNGVGGYESHCYSAGLSNMASGACYTFNPARGTAAAWVNSSAADTWWWLPTACSATTTSSSSSAIVSSSSAVASSSSAVSSSSVKVSSSSVVASSSSTKVSSSSAVASSSSSATSTTTGACIAFVNGTGNYGVNCYKSGLTNMASGKCYTMNPARSAVTWINADASDTYWWALASCTGTTTSSSSSVAVSSSSVAASSSSVVSSSSVAISSSSSSSVVASSSSSAISTTPPTALQASIDWVWTNRILDPTEANALGFYNYIQDQIMAEGGKLYFCVRWESNTAITRAQRDKFEPMLNRAINNWARWLKGYDGFPYDTIPVKIVGWAVKNASLLDQTGLNVPVYVNGGLESSGATAPRCPDVCNRDEFHSAGKVNTTYPNCTAPNKHFDMTLWGTDGFYGGAGGDWGSRTGSDYILSVLDAQEPHIIEHEFGHGFSLPDFYDADQFPPSGLPTAIMQAGASSVVTEWDGWMLRRVWTEMNKQTPARW